MEIRKQKSLKIYRQNGILLTSKAKMNIPNNSHVSFKTICCTVDSQNWHPHCESRIPWGGGDFTSPKCCIGSSRVISQSYSYSNGSHRTDQFLQSKRVEVFPVLRSNLVHLLSHLELKIKLKKIFYSMQYFNQNFSQI